MLNPSSKDRTVISRGIEEGVLVKNTNKYHPATPTKQPSVRRKTSAEIANTVNGFIQEARAPTKSATIKNKSANPMKQSIAESNRPGMSRNEMIQRLMQGQKLPIKPGNLTNAKGTSKITSPTATISFGKNVLKVSEKPLSKPRPEQGLSKVPPSTIAQASRMKSNTSNVGAETVKTASSVLVRGTDGKSPKSSGSAAVRRDQSTSGNQETSTKKRLSNHMFSEKQAAPRNYSPNYYLTSSSSEDEETGGPTRRRGYEKPTSPASKAKMWNEIHKSPGPSYPGWKFRPPAHGDRLYQLGPEELAETFKNLEVEADRASSKVQAEGPRQNKFSNYMKKIKSSSKAKDADTSTVGLEENINLKKMYSEQLDAMREKALASIKALDAETRGSDGDISLEVVKDGISRTYRGMSSTDMLKNAVESLQKHRKESFNLQKSDGSYLDRKAGYEFAQGDRLNRNEYERNKSAATRIANAGSGAAGTAGERVRVTKDDHVRTRREASGSREAQALETLRMKTKDNPLQKLKKISETLKMERANALSRRASASFNFSSSESDYEPDGFRREIK